MRGIEVLNFGMIMAAIFEDLFVICSLCTTCRDFEALCYNLIQDPRETNALTTPSPIPFSNFYLSIHSHLSWNPLNNRISGADEDFIAS